MEILETKLQELQKELKTHFDKAAEESKLNGAATKDTQDKIVALQKQLDAIDAKMVQRHAGSEPPKTLVQKMNENESLKRLQHDKSGQAVIEITPQDLSRKGTDTVDTSYNIGLTEGAVGYATTGILGIDRVPGITPEARQTLRVRDVLSARPTNMAVIDFVKVLTPMTAASPQVEASDKYQNNVTFQSVSEKVRTIATWIPATKQVLDDMTELAGYIMAALPYYVNLEEEVQLLSGDGTGENLHGLITQADAFLTSLLVGAAGWNRIDIIGHVIEQITANKELEPTFVVVHPTDWWSMRLQKDGFGRYILGDPQAMVRPTLFGLDVVVTTSISSGTFLVGSGNPIAAEIRDRMPMVVEISTSHADFFTKNLLAIRAEKRLALLVKRVHSFVSGAFTQSPY